LRLERFAGSTINYLGNQGCPFWRRFAALDKMEKPILRYDGSPKMNYVLHSCRGGVDYEFWHISDPTRRIKISSLSIVMIWNHHFYEGNVPHRVVPTELISFFN
jgi:hypothetical protein